MKKVLISTLIGLAAVLTVAKAASPVDAILPTEKPSVKFESGYKSTYDVLGLNFAPGGAYGSVELSTPFKYADLNLGASTAGKNFSELKASLDKTVNFADWFAVNLEAGTQYYLSPIQNRNVVGAILTLEKFSYLNKLVTPYVGYVYDITGLSVATTPTFDPTRQGFVAGGTRPFKFELTTWADLVITPAVEFSRYNSYQAVKAGGSINFVLWDKLSPFASVNYLNNNISQGSYAYNDTVQYVAGVSLSF